MWGFNMKKFSTLFILVFLFFSTTNVIAACKYKYDYQSGNSYQVCTNSSSTSIWGNNYQTGSSWSQTQNSNGSYYGRDKKGNYYNGNNNTGYYYNSGTGRSCYGTGWARTCY